ncbi:MAG: hypothetical protein K2X11_08765 [Acetobacteraceae bacterium]|nr:hypothetical protein [Acetobacteraceae bacterium]
MAVPRALLVPAIAALLLGCEMTPPSGPCAAPEVAAEAGLIPADVAPVASIGRRGVRLLDGLGGRVAVLDVQAGRRPDGLAHVGVRLANCTGRDFAFEAATQFYDVAAVAAQPPTLRRRVFLPAGTTRDYTEVSRNPAAASFFVEVGAAR